MSGALKRDEWETVRLGDVCSVVSGSTPKTANPEYWDGDTLWITPAELNEDSHYIYDTTRKITEAGRNSASLTLLPKGTVLLSSRAPIGKVGIVGTEMCCNQGFKNLVCSPVIFNNYLFWFLKGKTDYLNSLGRGATFKEISKGIVANIKIPLPPLDVQRRIADTLDKVTGLITLRKTQLEKLDELVKARFVELFGNILCDSDLPLVQLKELADIGSSKRIYANEYVESGVPFYRSKEIRELGTGLKPSVELFIKQERYDEIKAKYGVPKKGDILIAAIGATIGYSWIVDTDKPFYYKDGNLIILSTKNTVNPIFLNHTMGILIEDFKSKGVAGSAQLALTIGKLEKMMVINPSIDLQNQFAAFVEQTDKSKSVIQQSLDTLETLKKSLMQEYFGQ